MDHPVGQLLRDLESKVQRAEIDWLIPQFKCLDKRLGLEIWSPTFRMFDNLFQLSLYPNGEGKDSEANLCVKVHHLSGPKMIAAWNVFVINYDQCIADSAGCHDSLRKNTYLLFRNIGLRVDAENPDLDILDKAHGDALKIRLLVDRELDTEPTYNSQLASLLSNSQFSDVKLVVEGKEICAHRAILASRSPYFAAMFRHQMDESLSGRVKIDDIPFALFNCLLKYMYSGQLEDEPVHESKIKDVWKDFVELCGAADRFQLNDLKYECEMILLHHITVENAADLLEFAHRVHASTLKRFVLEFIQSNLKQRTDIIDKERLLGLDAELLAEIIMILTPVPNVKKRLRTWKPEERGEIQKLKLSELRAELDHRSLDTIGSRKELEMQLEKAIYPEAEA